MRPHPVEDIRIKVNLTRRSVKIRRCRNGAAVLDNLMGNALDAVADGGEITVSTHRVAERVAIEVADTGAGIAPEMLVRIFDPFFTTKDQGKGSGLGLAISYTLAEALGGALTVDRSRAGQPFVSGFRVDYRK